MRHGSKRDYPKIECYVDGKYIGITTWSVSLKRACNILMKKYPNAKTYEASYVC